MAIERHILQESEGYNYDFLTGCYFTGKRQLIGATAVWSDSIKEPSWNFAGAIDVEEDKVTRMVADVTSFLQEKGRLPSVVITPFTHPHNLREEIEQRGFIHKYTEVWMFYNERRPQVLLPDGLNIKKVEDDAEKAVMVDLFNRAHSGAEDEVYGELPPEYGEALRKFDPNLFNDRSITHYLGIMNGIPAGYATLINHDKFAGIYNVGIVPEFRRRGIGSTLTLNAVNDAFNQNSEYIFLITEQGTSNERLYNHIGFTTEFTSEGYVLDSSPED